MPRIILFSVSEVSNHDPARFRNCPAVAWRITIIPLSPNGDTRANVFLCAHALYDASRKFAPAKSSVTSIITTKIPSRNVIHELFSGKRSGKHERHKDETECQNTLGNNMVLT